ncbi:hypothetical protein DSM112329_01245 [Paraconexibacter sp. AEG42_29]|uniref:Uncharacterized protein n=1 Tax=Paraconexibacter sp. AEG42_29 TaxID=2997339 RepID=A0AAU7AS21_9ACTN
MSDDFPRWPPDWLDEYALSKEETLAAAGAVELRSGLRGDGQILFAVQWPDGLRYMVVDPVGGGTPQALRIGEKSEDGEIARLVEGLWSQALAQAKQLIDGEIQAATPLMPTLPDPGGDGGRRRRWGRG